MNLQMMYQNEADEAGSDLGGAPAPAQTIVTEPAGDVTPPAADATPPAAWFDSAPEDWRQQLAGEDEKRLNQLSRITDVKSFAESYFNAQDKIRSGETSNGLPDNPTDEQMNAYREANNIPATVEDYSLALDEGLVLGEADERIMGDVYKVAHENNVSNDVVSQLTNAMLKGRDQEEHAIQQQDGLDLQTADRQMRDTWGQDYEMNKNLIRGVLNGLPETVKDEFASARLANGQAVFNSPEMMNFFADAARAMNPSATVVPAGTGNPMQAIEGRKAELEARMSSPEWFKDNAAQKEYRDLLEAQERMKQ